MDNIVCLDVVFVNNICKYYQRTTRPKEGLCMKSYKLTLLCHYSEKFMKIYDGDAEIIKPEDLRH